MIKRALGAAAILALAACSKPADPAKTETTAPVESSNAAPEQAGAAPSRVSLMQAVGSWSFTEDCAHDGGMLLRANGEAFDETGPGLWAIDRQGRIVLIVRQHKMGLELDETAPREVKILSVATASEAQLTGNFDDGRRFTLHRCPSEVIDADRADLGASAGSTGVGRQP